MKNQRLSAIAIAAVATAGLLTGCSDSEDTSVSSSSSAAADGGSSSSTDAGSSSEASETSSEGTSAETSSADSASSSAPESSEAATSAASSAASSAAPSSTVKLKELEDDMKQQMNEKKSTPSEVTSVSCPGPIAAQVGATATCTVQTKSNGSKDYEVKITGVQGDDLSYSANPKN